MSNKYYLQLEQRETERLKEILATLPPYVASYFNSIALKQIRTRVGYARDIQYFFFYLHENGFKGKKLKEISLNDLALLKPEDIEEYRAYLTNYQKKDGSIKHNDKASLARKLSALNGLFCHLVDRDKLPKNPMRGVDRPNLEQKPILKLSQDEVYQLISEVKTGSKMSPRQLKFHELTVIRDTAIIMLLLGTGIRVSELVGLDMDDVNLEKNSIYVVRKGGDQEYVYFNDEVADALYIYMFEYIPDFSDKQPLTHRESLFPHTVDYNEKALFLSIRGNRMAVRSIQELVKKYTSLIDQKKITAHKLRSTFGTNLYNVTKDAYTVSKALGHKNIETSKKYIDYDLSGLKVAQNIHLLPPES